jgi:hypothetical protein
MISQYPGFCVECNQPYEAETQITKRDGAWVHMECPSPIENLEFCEKCFTFKALDGSCNCD